MDILLNAAMVLIMLGIGLSLRPADFLHLAKSPRTVIWGLFFQMVFLPLVGLLIAMLVDLPILKAGILLLTFCPGGSMSNFINYIIGGNVALAVSLTIINSLLTVFTIPILTNLALQFYLGKSTTIQLPLNETIIHIVAITLLPVVVGILLHYRYPKESIYGQRWIKITASILLFGVFAYKFLADESKGGSGLTPTELGALTLPMIALNLSILISGYILARYVVRLSVPDTMTIAIEIGLQNTAMAILIADTMLGYADMSNPALVYSLYSFWLTLLFAFIITRLHRRAISRH